MARPAAHIVLRRAPGTHLPACRACDVMSGVSPCGFQLCYYYGVVGTTAMRTTGAAGRMGAGVNARILMAAGVAVFAGLLSGNARSAAISFDCSSQFEGNFQVGDWYLGPEYTKSVSDCTYTEVKKTFLSDTDYLGRIFVAAQGAAAVESDGTAWLYAKLYSYTDSLHTPGTAMQTNLSVDQRWTFTLTSPYIATLDGWNSSNVGLLDWTGSAIVPFDFDNTHKRLLMPGTYSLMFSDPQLLFADYYFELDFTPFTGRPVNPSAVPLPAAAWLLLSGLGGIAALGRRKRMLRPD
jgi:hypothetical protein